MSDHFERVDVAFRRQVDRCPDKVAIWDPAGSATFAELWDHAARLAGALRGKGIGDGDAVGVFGIGDRDSIVAMLGVLLAGGHFVPVDPDYPAERAARMMAIAGGTVLLGTAGHDVPDLDGTAGVDVWHVRDLVATAEPVEGSEGSPDRLAYVMFTSGSTGAPKAVGVPHGALTALCLRDGPVRRREDDVFLAHTILTFDPSMLEIWSALLVGASVVCAPRKAVSLHETADLLRDERVTTAILTPAVFALMVETYPAALAELRCLIVGGDVMPVEHAARVRELCPDLEVVNCYGPTENCVVSTAFSLTGWDGRGVSVPIGPAVAGATAYVLDGELRPLPVGEVGDLHVGGDRLALGYVGDPALTEERFVPDPFVPGARMYRTGDRAALLPDGGFEFRGREDDELKVRGYRVNLAEVEALLAGDPEVREVVAVPVGSGHDRRIRAFVRPASAAVDAKEIRARVAARAPQFLVPDEIELVEEFSLAATGKVDRAALLSRVDSRPDVSPVAPSDDRAALAAMWRDRTGTAADSGVDFFDAGGSSLDLIQLIEDINGAFAVPLDFEDVYGLRSFEELWEMVESQRGSGT